MRSNTLLAKLGLLLVLMAVALGRSYASAPDANLPPASFQQYLPVVQRGYRPPESCLPRFAEPELVLVTPQKHGEPDRLGVADFNGDGRGEIVVGQSIWTSPDLFDLDILVNNGKGCLVVGTSSVFSGPPPRVQSPREFVLADFDGDGWIDIFVADEGMDAEPFPGYQNTLALSGPGNKLADATANCPQQYDMSHSATAADIDRDGDLDLYIGNMWGQPNISPQVWLNDGTGRFTVSHNRLPHLTDLTQNGFTCSEFVDVDNDSDPDLVLGDAGDDIDNEDSSRESVVLLNDGAGRFSLLPGAIPSKPFGLYAVGTDIKAVDVNRDGYQDLFMAYCKGDWTGRYIQILINKGDGTFRDETGTRLPQLDNGAPWIMEVELVDLDYDGDIDIATRHVGIPETSPPFYLNNGEGVFAPWDHGLEIGTWTWVFLDMDYDGRRDIVHSYPPYGGYDRYYLLRNMGCAGDGLATAGEPG